MSRKSIPLLYLCCAVFVSDLLAVDLALRSLADGVAHGGAHRVVALPAALRVAVAAGLGDGRHEVGLGAHSQCEGGQQHDQQGGAHGAERGRAARLDAERNWP